MHQAKRWYVVVLLTAAIIATLLFAGRSREVTEIRMEWSPPSLSANGDDAKVWIVVHRNGSATVTTFSPYRLLVSSQRHEELDARAANRIFAAARTQAVQSGLLAIRGHPKEEGDLFYLELTLVHGETLQGGGKLHRATPAVRDLIEDISAAVPALDNRSTATGARHFLRAEEISPARVSSIERRGAIAFSNIESLPTELRQTVEESIRLPRRFVAVDQEVYSLLSERSLSGQSLFLLEGRTAHQLTLFRHEKKDFP